MATPTLFALLGPGQDDLTSAVEKALGALGVPVPPWPSRLVPQTPARGLLRGLFAGGTLCDEAMLIAADALGPIRSNIPLRPDWALGPPGHTMIDFGEDEMTRGRAHPMIDPTLRLERLAAEAADPSTGVLLMDVVLGYGAEPDPAALLAPAIEAARAGRELAVVVSLCGTSADPQDRDRQAAALHAAGAAVFSSNAAAARHAIALIEGESA
jgi:FdrA protein